MNWFIVNGISAALAILSLTVFVITARKLAGTIRLGRELAHQVQLATVSLDRAVAALREEHQDFRDENRKLDARIGESSRIRRDIDRSISHMEQLHNQLHINLSQLNSTLGRANQRSNISQNGPIMTRVMKQAEVTMQPQRREKALPVFVQRKVRKTNLNNPVKL